MHVYYPKWWNLPSVNWEKHILGLYSACNSSDKLNFRSNTPIRLLLENYWKKSYNFESFLITFELSSREKYDLSRTKIRCLIQWLRKLLQGSTPSHLWKLIMRWESTVEANHRNQILGIRGYGRCSHPEKDQGFHKRLLKISLMPHSYCLVTHSGRRINLQLSCFCPKLITTVQTRLEYKWSPDRELSWSLSAFR